MKIKYMLIFGILISILFACNPYKRISLSGSDFYGRNKVIKNIDRYDVYVHQADSVYEMSSPVSQDSTKISGQINPLNKTDRENQQVVSTDERLSSNERDDIHIYLDDDFEVDLANANEYVVLEPRHVKEVKLSAKQKMGVAGLILTIVGAVVLTLLLIAGLIIGLLFGSGDGSTSDSGESNSGNGNSDQSDSGGSDSGCYVATMAYGSYEAPQVLVLRKFRDQILQNSKGGRAFIQWYYKNSPSFVERHKSKMWLHIIIRKSLNGFVFLLKLFLGK